MRGYTALAEAKAPEDVARLLSRFYALAIDILSNHEAVIDKLIGDECWVAGRMSSLSRS